jgi:hypothetical protein
MQGNAVLHMRDIGGGFDSQLQGNAAGVPVLPGRDLGNMPGALMGGTKEQFAPSPTLNFSSSSGGGTSMVKA